MPTSGPLFSTSTELIPGGGGLLDFVFGFNIFMRALERKNKEGLHCLECYAYSNTVSSSCKQA